MLTPEKMRADIAEILCDSLEVIGPESIGLDDDLVDLGLDSMRLMTLALKWQDEGHPVDFSILAEYFTLREWLDALSGADAA